MSNFSTVDKRDLQRVFMCTLILVCITVSVALKALDSNVLVGAISAMLGFYLGKFDNKTNEVSE